VSLPPKVGPLQDTLPETVSPIPATAISIATPSPNAVTHNQIKNTLRARLVIGLIIGAVSATVGVSTFLTRTRSAKTPTVVASAPIDNVPLQVRVEPLGKGLIDVRWNPQSAFISQARDGRLVITEPNQRPRILSLEGEQLKTGHLTYQSAAESIEFNLEIVDRSGAIVKESVMALQSGVASPPLPGTAPQTPREQTATPKPTDIPNREVTAAVPQLSQPPVRIFVPPASQRTTAPRVIVDAPPTLTNGPAIPPGVGLPVPLPAILPPSTKDGAVPQQVRVESNVEAANLIKKVIPIYPQIARSARIQGTVRFTAHIGKDGRILNLKFTSGPPVLVDSATTAVKQWVYRPTLLNGEPVEVITQVEVNFTLNSNAH
jgi:protein TonB